MPTYQEAAFAYYIEVRRILAENMAVRFDVERTTFDGQVGGILFWIVGIHGFDQTKAVLLVCNWHEYSTYAKG